VNALAEWLPPAPCERCGGGNSAQARFCQHCGTALGSEDPAGWFELADDESTGAVPDAPYEALGPTAVVTALVCEVSRPSAIDADENPWAADADRAGEDPAEALAAVREALGRFGAVVEELPGATDTLAAVFGPEPEGRDGPISAVRAAAEIRRALGDDAPRLRAAVGTGEILGEGPDAEELWRGRVIDLATGLQRRAEAGEILVAEGVVRRIADAAHVEPLDPHARAEGDAQGPFRLLRVDPEPAPEAVGSPALIGREKEWARVRAAFERAVNERVGVIVRITGEPGMGTSRLAEECLAELTTDVATMVALRWGPAAEPDGPCGLAGLLEALAGVAPASDADRVRAAIDALLDGRADAERVAAQLLPALGLGGTADAEAMTWALRRTLEAAAAERPLAVLVDDADRAGTWFPELLLAATSGAVSPILVVATGGPAGWPAGWERGSVEHLRLEPLDDLRPAVDDFLHGSGPFPETRERVTHASGGNPLHAEHLVAALVDRGALPWERRRWAPEEDSGTGERDLPSLLSLRLEELEVRERAFLGLLAVAGVEIPWDLARELAPSDDESSIGDLLAALEARRFLRADVTDAQPTYVFPHRLVREVVASTVPPEIRAEVHERCARWLQERYPDRPGRHAHAIAAHLEAVARLRPGAGRSGGDQGRRAAAVLTSTAERRSALGDEEGRLADLERAAALLEPGDPARAEILLRTATALAGSGRRSDAGRVAARAMRAARDAGDRALELRARLLKAVLVDASRRRDRTESIWEAAAQAEIACRDAADDAGLSAVWSARAAVHRRWGHWAAAADDAERAADHAARAGLAAEESSALRMLVLALEESPVPMDESVARCRAVLDRAGDRRGVQEEASAVVAVLLARAGASEEAETRIAAAERAVDERSSGAALARALHRSARVRILTGDLAGAEERLGRALDAAARAGDDGVRAATGATLAHVLIDTGRAEAALELLEDVSRTAVADDVVTQVAWRSARARALASLGRVGEARSLARRAIRLAEQTDLTDPRANALLAQAEVLRSEGRPNEAAPFARRALRALERRGAVVPAARARSLLASLERPDDVPPGEESPAELADGLPAAPPTTDDDAVSDEPAEDDVSASPFAEFVSGESEAAPGHVDGEPLDQAPPEERRAAKATAGWWSFGRR
jgi:tetratricopeptide (TPR) repeat protein